MRGQKMMQDIRAGRRSETECYVLRIELEDIEPLIWRTVTVGPYDLSLDALADVLLTAMGWPSDRPDYMLELDGERLCSPLFRDNWPDDAEPADHAELGLSLADLPVGYSFTLFYDHDAGWRHKVTIVEPPRNILDPDRQRACLDGANACPPPGVDGAEGYRRFLEALRADEPGTFDPTAFSVQATNATIAAEIDFTSA